MPALGGMSFFCVFVDVSRVYDDKSFILQVVWTWALRLLEATWRLLLVGTSRMLEYSSAFACHYRSEVIG